MKASAQTEIAYSKLRAELLACRLVPGERIHISRTVERLDLNLSAIREALSRLSAEGLVVATPQRGFRAAPLSIADLKDLTPVRIDIEASCLRRSLKNGDLGWEARLVAAYHQLSKTPIYEKGTPKRASEAFAAAHDEFHDALVAACDNTWLLRVRNIMYFQWERYRRLTVELSPAKRDIAAEHRGLFDAAIERDQEKIVKLIEEHFTATTSVLLSAKAAELKLFDVQSVKSASRGSAE